MHVNIEAGFVHSISCRVLEMSKEFAGNFPIICGLKKRRGFGIIYFRVVRAATMSARHIYMVLL